MKNRSLVAKKQREFQLASFSLSENMKIVTRNNNTQNVRKPYWFVQTLEKLDDLEKYWANATCNL